MEKIELIKKFSFNLEGEGCGDNIEADECDFGFSHGFGSGAGDERGSCARFSWIEGDEDGSALSCGMGDGSNNIW